MSLLGNSAFFAFYLSKYIHVTNKEEILKIIILIWQKENIEELNMRNHQSKIMHAPSHGLLSKTALSIPYFSALDLYGYLAK